MWFYFSFGSVGKLSSLDSLLYLSFDNVLLNPRFYPTCYGLDLFVKNWLLGLSLQLNARIGLESWPCWGFSKSQCPADIFKFFIFQEII